MHSGAHWWKVRRLNRRRRALARLAVAGDLDQATLDELESVMRELKALGWEPPDYYNPMGI